MDLTFIAKPKVPLLRLKLHGSLYWFRTAYGKNISSINCRTTNTYCSVALRYNSAYNDVWYQAWTDWNSTVVILVASIQISILITTCRSHRKSLPKKKPSTTSAHKIRTVQSGKESAYFTKTLQVVCFTPIQLMRVA